ncbi:hypothetical protein [Yersinia aldovae]|uniref:hypothetical protein n=1 Tax=Yersinia aldovae TaxID=29483 RepID=UPI0005AC9C05|nr:hypothetical protein [Yersinia aldovae]AJJ64880.1 hypothetical protein AT01_165 [Yersinia aldovae 670-83]
MSLQLKVIDLHITSTDCLSLDMGKRLQVAAGRDVKNKLATGEIKVVDGRYVGESLKVKRPSKLSSQPKKPQLKAY